MARAKRVNHPDGSLYGLRIDCPACKRPHVLAGWEWNGSLDAPTFSPSLLVRGVECDFDEHGNPRNRRDVVCHSFVRSGWVEFLSDSTHALAGQTVDLPEIDDS